MAKLRTNHGNARSGGSFGASLRPVYTLIALLLISAVILWPKIRQGLESIEVPRAVNAVRSNNGSATSDGRLRLYLPVGQSDQVVHHAYYSLGYDNDWEQPRWVAYSLSRAQVTTRGMRRVDDFRPDSAIRDGSAEREDYRRSGYTRGHLAPAGDMNFDSLAMSESFFYSNMSPQIAVFNGAVWRELEENVRDWAVDKGNLYIITGPIVKPEAGRIGKNEVAIPAAFYKVLLSEGGEGIAFVIEHDLQTQPLSAFAKTIDEVEELTGLDFFPELTALAIPEAESGFNLEAWPIDNKRYQRRVKQWNHQNH